MGNFFQRFISHYFYMLDNKSATYKSFVRRRISNKSKSIFFYEKTLDWITGKLSKNKFNCILMQNSNYFIENIERFENTYNLLGDDYSKSKYAEYISFKAINSNRVKLQTGRKDINADLRKLNECKVTNGFINDYSNIGDLNLYDLSPLGYGVKLINSPIGTLIDFVYEQYAYKDLFKVKNNDVVIDCGGAIGDTAVYFAAKGASKVYVFEFIQSNIELINKQIDINPDLKGKISIIDKPVWDASNIELSYFDNGNSSRVGDAGVYPNAVKTISIDDVVTENQLEAIDFIKMDIEGAELPALRGAKKTIRKYKPKLAVCVYHKNDDLIEIPKYINSLNPDYEFYFDYYTDIGWEAVLYAVDRTRV